MRKSAAGASILRVPGARASTVHAGIWDLVFSALLKARTGMSRFLHSMMSLCAPVQRAPEGRVWPMPLPFPEMFRRRRSRCKEGAQRKWALNYIILVLDWLYVGERLVSVDSFRLGCRLNKGQWEVVKRLTPLIDSWNFQTAVGPAEMGRCAAKVESVEEELRRLEEAARGPQKELRGYFGQLRSNKQSPWGCEGHPGESVGILEGGLEHVAKDLEPERLKFQGIPSFDPLPFLDKANQATYAKPLDYAADVLADDLDLPRVKVRCKAGQRLRILEQLDEVQRLSLFRAEDCRMGFANGLFGIPKDQERDRMILDARRPNSVEESERRWIFSLGSLAQFQYIYLEDDEDMYLHAEDLREFYHCFIVGEQRQRNVLAGEYVAAELQHLKSFHAGLRGAEKVVGAFKTLAMGDTNAVAYGQVSHLSLLLRTAVFGLKDFMSLRMRPSRDRVRAGLMIDDFLVIESRKRGEDGEAVRQKVEKVREAYEEHGLPRHAGKAVEGETEGEFWGAQLDGRLGVLRPSLKKLVPLVNVVLKMLNLGYTTVGLLELLSGAFVAAFQLRRRLMSALAEIYAAQRSRGRREIIKMSGELKDELFCILGLLVVSCIDFRLRPATKLVASDASSYCEAAVTADVKEGVTRELQRHGLQKGLWNRLLSPEGAYLREVGQLEPERELPEEHYKMHPLWEEVVTSQRFEVFGKVKHTKGRQHINLKEVRAALAAEAELGRQQPGSYYVHLQDSQVALACMTKGRSSSWQINRELRRSICQHVGQNVKGSYGYVRSKLGRCREAGMNYTKLAESYPRMLCSIPAGGMAVDCALLPKRRRLSVADCVRDNSKRLGEAQHPGPRRAPRVRETELDEFQLLEPQTVAMRSKLWQNYQSWLQTEIGCYDVGELLVAPGYLVKTLEAYGRKLYNEGAPLHYYRQLLAHVQREHPTTKLHMSSAWQLVSKWELAEPTQHRPPVPEPIVQAVVCLAYSWRWPRFGGCVLLAFYGACRIGEVLRAERADLLTPADLLDPEEKIYLCIKVPKSRRRGANVQYTTFSNSKFASLLVMTWQHLGPRERLFPHSAACFRRRWDSILAHVGIQQLHRLTPGSLRGGGAVWAHKQGYGIQNLMWHMRLQHQRTLSYYLQEVTAVSILPMLTENCRENIKLLQGLLPLLIEAFHSAQECG